jgi:hypothetical protein
MISTHNEREGNQTHNPFSSFLSEKGWLRELLLVEGATRAPVMVELKKEGL